MKEKFLLLLAILLLLAAPAFADVYPGAYQGSEIAAYGQLSSSYYQGVSEFWVTERGTVNKTTCTVDGQIQGMGSSGGAQDVNFSGTVTKNQVVSSYDINSHGFRMDSGSSLSAVSGIVSSATAGARAHGTVEQSQSIQQNQFSVYPFPGAWGSQSSNASQHIKIESGSGQ